MSKSSHLLQHKIVITIAVLFALGFGIAIGVRVADGDPTGRMLDVLNFGMQFLNTVLIVILASLLIRTRVEVHEQRRRR